MFHSIPLFVLLPPIFPSHSTSIHPYMYVGLSLKCFSAGVYNVSGFFRQTEYFELNF